MSKILGILTALIIILPSLSQIFITEIKAGSTLCSSSAVKINYKNPANNTSNEGTFFPENSGDLNFEFTIDPSNTSLPPGKKEVRLKVYGDPVTIGPFGNKDFFSNPVVVSDRTFRLIVDASAPQAKLGTHTGNLEWRDAGSNGAFSELCSIKYQVGIKDACKILNPPKEVQPDTAFSLQFIGKANTDYSLSVTDLSQPGIPQLLATKATNSSGLGLFEDIKINGNLGHTFQFRIYYGPVNECTTNITITSSAPPPPAPNPSVSILPVPFATPCNNPKECTRGGGDPCDTGDNRGPAFKTAIGCIHTNPNEFVRDLMTFIIGIGGGVAFLMMLLGAFQMLTSAGNPDTLRAGRERLTSAVIGLLIVIFAILLLQIIGWDILRIEGFGRGI